MLISTGCSVNPALRSLKNEKVKNSTVTPTNKVVNEKENIDFCLKQEENAKKLIWIKKN